MKKYIAIAGFFLLFFCYFACSKPHYTNTTTEYDFSILVFYDGVAIALSDVDDAYHLPGNTCALDKTKLKIVRNYDDVVLNNDDLMFFSAGSFYMDINFDFIKNKPSSIKSDFTYLFKFESTVIPKDKHGIATAKDLQAIGKTALARKGSYLLCNDLDLQGIDFIPIGDSEENAFSGKFDGNQKTIYELHISTTNDYVGLFGYVKGTQSEIVNLNIVSAQVSGGSYVGAVVGFSESVLTNIQVSKSSILGKSNLHHIGTAQGCQSCSGTNNTISFIP